MGNLKWEVSLFSRSREHWNYDVLSLGYPVESIKTIQFSYDIKKNLNLIFKTTERKENKFEPQHI